MPIEINGTGSIVGVDSLSTPAVTNAAGSASAPSITFTGDSNTGIYSPAADTIAFTEGGVESVRIDSSGRVGIGTTSPQLSFVCSNGGANGFEIDPTQSTGTVTGINSYNRSSSAFTPLRFNASEHRWDTASTERARIDSSGRLLVGTSSARSVFFNFSGLTPGLQIEGTSFQNRNISIISSDNSVFNADSGIILARQKSGSIGGNTIVSNGDALGLLSFQGSDGADFVEAARIEAFVDGAPGTDDMPGRLVFSTTADGASSPTERMRIRNDGQIWCYSSAGGIFSGVSAGAGTTTATFVGQHSATAVNNGTNSFIVWSNGNVVNTNNSYGALSDIKLKENIVDANSQWNDLKALQVRNYNFKEGQTHTQIGLVAQEVELVSPGLVTESPDRDADGNDLGTTTKSVNYSVLYMKAVKALQEAMERIETLEAKVAALESA